MIVVTPEQKEPEKRPEIKKKEPPGCPPGPPPDLIEMREFDSDYESEEEEEPRSKKLKSVRHEEVSPYIYNLHLRQCVIGMSLIRYQKVKTKKKTKTFLSNSPLHCNNECWPYRGKILMNS